MNLSANLSSEIRDHFPFPSIRPAQETALKAFEQAVREGKKFIVAELPTGSGKSGDAISAGSWAKTLPGAAKKEPGSYILTPQKTLQDQYVKEFEGIGLACLKGKSNYTCGYRYSAEEGGKEMNCEEAGFFYPEHDEPGGCKGYKLAKKHFSGSPVGTTNFAYYLTEANFVGQLPNRRMLILDEAHNTEQQILGLASIEITRWRCKEVGIRFEDVPYIRPCAAGTGQALDWLNSEFKPKALAAVQDLTVEAESLRDAKGSQAKASKLMKQARSLERFLQSLNLFLAAEDKGEWMVWSESETANCPRCRAKLKPGTTKCWKRTCGAPIPERPAKMVVKPLTASLFSDKLLFSKADKVVLMSATILHFQTFLQNLGIDRNDAVCISVPSDFPVENRRILYHPVADMSSKTIDASLPLMAAEVAALLRKHKDDKGIIHTHTYKINKYIVGYLKDNGFGDRVLTHEEGIPGDRERCVQEHIEKTGQPTVIVSPSMTEGLDLIDDLSRFSIVCKVPFPFLSPYVRARMNRPGGQKWYAWTTALTMQQATGRSNRHKDDKAVHYILDKAFGWFVQQNGDMFSPWWMESVMFPGDYAVDWDSGLAPAKPKARPAWQEEEA